jgi:ribosomal protein S28E/S33
VAKRKKQTFSAPNEVRAIARERVGPVKAGEIITPKADRKPKHKEDLLNQPER